MMLMMIIIFIILLVMATFFLKFPICYLSTYLYLFSQGKKTIFRQALSPRSSCVSPHNKVYIMSPL